MLNIICDTISPFNEHSLYHPLPINSHDIYTETYIIQKAIFVFFPSPIEAVEYSYSYTVSLYNAKF